MTGKRAGMAQSRTAGSPVTESRNKNNTGRFPWNHWFTHTGCLFLPFISVHLPLLLLLCSSLSRRLPLRQHDFRSGPDRCRISGSRACRTTASLPESVHTLFPQKCFELIRFIVGVGEPKTSVGSGSAASAKKCRQTLRSGKYARGFEKVPQAHFYSRN